VGRDGARRDAVYSKWFILGLEEAGCRPPADHPTGKDEASGGN